MVDPIPPTTAILASVLGTVQSTIQGRLAITGSTTDELAALAFGLSLFGFAFTICSGGEARLSGAGKVRYRNPTPLALPSDLEEARANRRLFAKKIRRT